MDTSSTPSSHVRADYTPASSIALNTPHSNGVPSSQQTLPAFRPNTPGHKKRVVLTAMGSTKTSYVLSAMRNIEDHMKTIQSHSAAYEIGYCPRTIHAKLQHDQTELLDALELVKAHFEQGFELLREVYLRDKQPMGSCTSGTISRVMTIPATDTQPAKQFNHEGLILARIAALGQEIGVSPFDLDIVPTYAAIKNFVQSEYPDKLADHHVAGTRFATIDSCNTKFADKHLRFYGKADSSNASVRARSTEHAFSVLTSAFVDEDGCIDEGRAFHPVPQLKKDVATKLRLEARKAAQAGQPPRPKQVRPDRSIPVVVPVVATAVNASRAPTVSEAVVAITVPSSQFVPSTPVCTIAQPLTSGIPQRDGLHFLMDISDVMLHSTGESSESSQCEEVLHVEDEPKSKWKRPLEEPEIEFDDSEEVQHKETRKTQRVNEQIADVVQKWVSGALIDSSQQVRADYTDPLK